MAWGVLPQRQCDQRAAQRLRQQLRCTLPIVVFSAEVGEATLEQVALAGATDLLPKPATPRMVLDMIYKHCPSRPAGAAELWVEWRSRERTR